MPATETTPVDPVDEYRKLVVAWLVGKEEKWRETAGLGLGKADECASFYAAAYHNAWRGIVDRQPERKAVSDG